MGILSVAAPHLIFALLASDSSDIDHHFIDLALGTSREFTIKGLMQVYHCIQLPYRVSAGMPLHNSPF